MKDKAKKIVRNLLLGAIASLYNTHAQATEQAAQSWLESLDKDDKNEAVRALKNKI